MSDVAIFAAGSVMFVITTWATIAYGLAYVHQMRLRDLESSETLELKPDGQFTDIYVASNRNGQSSSAAAQEPAEVPENG